MKCGTPTSYKSALACCLCFGLRQGWVCLDPCWGCSQSCQYCVLWRDLLFPSSQDCWLEELPAAAPCVTTLNCGKSQKPQMEVLKCHHVPLPSMNINSHELLIRHTDTLFNWQVTSVRFMDLSKIWSNQKWKRQSSDERMKSRVNQRGSGSLWWANMNLKLAPPPTPLLCFLSPSQAHRCMSLVYHRDYTVVTH